MAEKKVYDFRKDTSNYKQMLQQENKNNGENISSLLDMTGGGAVVFDYDYEQRCDSNISESDLPRL